VVKLHLILSLEVSSGASLDEERMNQVMQLGFDAIVPSAC
jgi:hypothetical protein